MYSSYYLSNQYSDITLILSNQRIPAHRVVLSQCQYFSTLFNSTMRENQTRVVEIMSPITPKNLQIALALLYSADIPTLTIQELVDFLRESQFLLLTESNLDWSNLIPTLVHEPINLPLEDLDRIIDIYRCVTAHFCLLQFRHTYSSVIIDDSEIGPRSMLDTAMAYSKQYLGRNKHDQIPITRIEWLLQLASDTTNTYKLAFAWCRANPMNPNIPKLLQTLPKLSTHEGGCSVGSFDVDDLLTLDTTSCPQLDVYVAQQARLFYMQGGAKSVAAIRQPISDGMKRASMKPRQVVARNKCEWIGADNKPCNQPCNSRGPFWRGLMCCMLHKHSKHNDANYMKPCECKSGRLATERVHHTYVCIECV